MPILDISGILVAFPYQPYECQKLFMQHALAAVKNGHNALLESPTGTGKTLCLLCALLSYQQTVKASIQCTVPADGPPIHGDGLGELRGRIDETVGGSRSIPVIYYASRTHSQLAQVVRELKKTALAPKTVVLGSREQSCVHEKVSRISSVSTQAAICNRLCAWGKCEYKGRVGEVVVEMGKMTARERIMDLEELGTFARRLRACPFFTGREMLNEAELVLLPYNYLLDSKMGLNLNLKNAIVVIDEAHNIEGFCSDVFSFELCCEDLKTAQVELGDLERSLRTGELVALSEGDSPIDMATVAQMSALIATMYQLFMSVPFDDDKRSFSGDGNEIFGLLNSININHNNVVSSVSNLIELKTSILDRAFTAGKSTRLSLQTIIDFLKAVFGITKTKDDAEGDDSQSGTKLVAVKKDFAESFRLYVCPADDRLPNGHRKVCYWCFNPGLAMKELCSKSVRSVILASGTLSPLASFAFDLQIPFEVQFENQHVIDKKQVFIGAVGRGPTGVELSSAFGKRGLDQCKHEIGLTILKVAQTVPDGLLVFFPSYTVLQDCLTNWRKKGTGNGPSLMEVLEKTKHVVYEPRDKKEMLSQMQKYYALLDDKSRNGAIFFAICRGKVSEGLDFADKKGRAVIIAGLPYPPFKDPKIVLKRRYLEELSKEKHVLRGDEWYNQQSARAVNQAIGRVIRHRHDYGAIILADSRFSEPKNIAYLSKWLRPELRPFAKFSELELSLKSFFTMFDDTQQTASLHTCDIELSPADMFDQKPHLAEEYSEREELRSIELIGASSMENIGDVLRSLSEPIISVKRPLAKGNSAKEYLAQVKIVLDHESYKRFNTLLKQYKSKQLEIDGLFDQLSRLFNGNDRLMHGFRQFVPAKHLAAYEILVGKMAVQRGIPPKKAEGDSVNGVCIICKIHKPRAPFKAPCDHVACFSCWSNYLRNASNTSSVATHECPECHVRLRMTLLKKIKDT